VGRNYGGVDNGLGFIKIIDTATNAITGTIDLGRVGNVPASVTIAPNANFAYVTNSQDNTVTVIDITPQ
jgi:DNA-binding beta-propeller fold protein YncE